MSETKNILFLCTGNSARSILAEVILTAESGGRYTGFSAGSKPTGTPNRFALELLGARGHATAGLRSKSWDEFAAPDAPKMDIIITVCDSAAGETCPFWPGHPASAHWGLPDPAGVPGGDTAERAAFVEAYAVISTRINAFLALPPAQLQGPALKLNLDRIGQLSTAGNKD